MVLIDLGSAYGNYCADISRTFPVNGKFTDRQKELYNTVLEAQKRGIAAARAGVDGASVDAAARDYINSRGYEGKFGHSLGHSLGLEIHESPNFGPGGSDKVPSGVVISVEPGIYLEGKYGCRIEDMIGIKTDGTAHDFTKSRKDLIELF